MREWHLTPNDPMAPRISADARTGRTTVADDQTWQLQLGGPDEPAVTLETRYGGRVGLARLVPIWMTGKRQVYETQGYHTPPALVAFAPDYLRVRADLTVSLRLTLEFWTMESQAVGGRFTVHNTGDQPQEVRLDLTAQVARENKTLNMIFLSLENGQTALQLGRLDRFQPVMLLEGARDAGAKAALSRTLTVPAGGSAAARWVVAGLPDRNDSLLLAHRWLARAWDAHLAAIERRASAAPQIDTGDPGWDLALAWSQHLILRSFLAATGSLPHPSFVSARKTGQGYAVGGVHAGGFNAPWGGQTVPDALLIAPAVALAAPELAQGVVRNFLAVQRDDGWIDAKPGLDGQHANVIAPPLLATLAYTVYHYTNDKRLLHDCLDGLLAFFERWFKPDMDRDRDGLPEWSDAAQGAFGDSPTLAQHRRWAQGADITTLEAPDLAAYLLREAASLIRIAEVLERDDVRALVEPRREALRAHLQAMWNAGTGAFHYRDRDSHACPSGEMVFEAKGDQSLREPVALAQPSRLILRVTGGMSHKPKLTCTIEGTAADGQSAQEMLDANAFTWYRGSGTATTATIWRAITGLKFDGLSRVYTVQASTLDLTRHDQSLFAPLWTGDLDPAQVEALVAMLTDPDRYWREYGVCGCPATDPAYDPAHQNGCGGVWPRWNVLIAWALLDRGYTREATDLFRRVMAAQVRTLTNEHTFRSFTNPDTGEGLGDAETIEGAVSWGWFARLFGGFVLGPDAVVIGGPFAFAGETMTWTQHGVTLRRSENGTAIRFPTGHEVSLPPDADPQIVRDPTAKPAPPSVPEPEPPDAPGTDDLGPLDDLLPEVD